MPPSVSSSCWIICFMWARGEFTWQRSALVSSLEAAFIPHWASLCRPIFSGEIVCHLQKSRLRKTRRRIHFQDAELCGCALRWGFSRQESGFNRCSPAKLRWRFLRPRGSLWWCVGGCLRHHPSAHFVGHQLEFLHCWYEHSSEGSVCVKR